MDGYVYKLVEWYDRLGEEHSNLVDVFEATVPDAVRAIEISSKVINVYVVVSCLFNMQMTIDSSYLTCTRERLRFQFHITHLCNHS